MQEKAQQGDRKAQALLTSAMLAAFGRLQKLQMPVQVQRCACGAEHLLLLATTGLVFASGRNSHGQPQP
ncbi:unnamed protein product [Effrenium voratum]|uniref:Uncharacterized protein n=1 Tax=Effrenium voratum TaxID=2562239 RepID=A0AA36JRX7_9DINO|nr:unnamed protein product [Effrenium voratum]